MYDNSIAVLPFQDLSPKKDQEFFCDGMSEEIINVLSQLDWLKVIARTSAFMFKGKNEDMREIGRKLGVGYLLEGSIRKSENRLRITAQLINAESGMHKWSENFDRELDDVFTIQDEIAMAIVENLKAKIPGSKKQTLVRHGTDNSDLYNLYLLGRFYTNKRNTDSLNKAIDYYQEAISQDPSFALAYAGLSEAYTLSGIGYGAIPLKEAYTKSKETALKAIELDNGLCEAHTSLAFSKQYFEFDWPTIEKEWKTAISLNPGYAPAHQWYAEYLFIMKRWDEAYREISLALELDPLSFIIHTELGWLYHYQHKIDQAIEQYKKVIEMAPDFAVVFFNLGITYALKKKYQEAIDVSQNAVKLSGGSPFMKAGLAYVYALSGDIASAVEIRDEMIALVNSGQKLHGPLVTVHVGLNEKEEALKCLEMASQNRENMMYLIRNYYEDYLGTHLLSDDPRFNEIQRKIGLET
jgi:TolB-like protein/Tfp pilus assembly protein PilF